MTGAARTSTTKPYSDLMRSLFGRMNGYRGLATWKGCSESLSLVSRRLPARSVVQFGGPNGALRRL
jgi:hypothetical protein